MSARILADEYAIERSYVRPRVVEPGNGSAEVAALWAVNAVSC